MKVEGINHHRKAIASIDRALIRLLRKRILIVEKTWATKVALGLPLVDKAQEERVIRRAQKWALYYTLSPRLVEHIFKEILWEGKRLAKPPATRRPRRSAPSTAVPARSRRAMQAAK